MDVKTARRMALLCVLVALAAGGVAAVGVFARGDGSTVIVTSPRGETYPMAVSGVYAFNAQRVVAEGIGWDLFTLLCAVPAMLLCTPALARGSVRGRLFALGLLGYFFYQYLMYALTWAFGPLLLPFVGLFSASLAGVLWVGASLVGAGMNARFSEGFPRRGMALLCFALGSVLLAMWLGRIVAALRGDLAAGMLLGQTTMVVQVLDLGLIVPLTLFTGVTTWRRRPLGYVLSSVLVVKAVAMALAICAMLLAAWQVEGTLELPPLLLFAAAAAAALGLGVRMYRGVREDDPGQPTPGAVPAMQVRG